VRGIDQHLSFRRVQKSVQRTNIAIYAIVDPDIRERMIFSVYLVGTGHEIPFDTAEYTFLGTVSLLDGQFMFHIFYKLEGYRGE
jgi:hypothetical protein